MGVTLTWDLFIIVFTAVVIAYSFIIGRKESVKIIIATYVAVIAVQGVGNIVKQALAGTEPILATLGIETESTLLSAVKLALFVAVVIAVVVRSGISVQYTKEPKIPVQVGLTAVFGFTTAGLLLATLLTYVAGLPLLDAALPAAPALSAIVQVSPLMQLVVSHQDLWFSLPAIAILAAGIMGNKS